MKQSELSIRFASLVLNLNKTYTDIKASINISTIYPSFDLGGVGSYISDSQLILT